MISLSFRDNDEKYAIISIHEFIVFLDGYERQSPAIRCNEGASTHSHYITHFVHVPLCTSHHSSTYNNAPKGHPVPNRRSQSLKTLGPSSLIQHTLLLVDCQRCRLVVPSSLNIPHYRSMKYVSIFLSSCFLSCMHGIVLSKRQPHMNVKLID